MLHDLRFGLRSLARSPLFAGGAIATLALGIGVNATMFSLTSSALLRPLAGIARADQMVWVSSVWREQGRLIGLSYPDYLDYREASPDVFTDMLAFRSSPLSLGSGGAPERIRGQAVSGSFFPTLGVRAALGRLLAPTDDVRGGAERIATISYQLWQRRFGGRPEILGQSILINGREFRLVGVAAPDFRGPSIRDAADVWVPFAIWPELRSSEPGLLDNRRSSWLSVMGRLRPDASVARAQASLSRVAAHLETTYPQADKDRGVAVTGAGSPVPPEGRGDLFPLAVLLLTLTGVVLLIACANIANLLLARGAGRSLEVAIRAAVGASRWRLVRQLLTESMLLALAGAAGGLLLSFWTSDLLVSLAGPELEALRPAVNPRVLGFTTVLAVVSVCAFGLMPALTSTRTALLPFLRLTPSAGGSRSRLQSVFVVTQLSLSLVLLLAAGLSLRALDRSTRIDLGFESRNLLTASYDLVLQNYAPERRVGFRRDLLARVREIRGVESAALANLPPLSGTLVGDEVESSDDGATRARAMTFLNGVGPEYFSTLQIPIVRGRAFSDRDTSSAPGVVIVNQTLARRLWNTEDVVGRSLRFDSAHARPLEVAGVAKDAKYDEPTERPRAFLYLCLAQQPVFDTETLLVRTLAGASVRATALEDAIHGLDASLPAFDVRPFDAVLRDRADKQRAMTVLFASFGLLALLLASLGLYGVMAYTTACRTREMGVRLALGATPGQLTRLIARDGLRLALIGTCIGAVLALPLAKVLGALVFGIDIADLAGFAASCALLIVVAVVAAVLPAWRATQLDPMAALRTE